MITFVSLRKRLGTRPFVRPWALAVPVLVLLVALPQLRPLRHPVDLSVDEQLRLASINALVTNPITSQTTLANRLAIDNQKLDSQDHDLNRHIFVGLDGHHYSDQPPMLAFILSGPYWLMRRMGVALERAPVMATFLLTVLGATLPVAGAAGLVYRISRMFEDRPRPPRRHGGRGGVRQRVVFLCHGAERACARGGAGAGGDGKFCASAGQPGPTHGGPWLLLAGLCAAWRPVSTGRRRWCCLC